MSIKELAEKAQNQFGDLEYINPQYNDINLYDPPIRTLFIRQ